MIVESFELATPAPFYAAGIFEFFARRAIAGVEAADGRRYARTIRLPDGPGAFEVIALTEPRRLQLNVEATSGADAHRVPELVQRLFDLGADAGAIDAHLASEPAFAEQVARLPGLRVPGAIDFDELVVRAIVGQQISVARARTHLESVAARLGTPYASGITGLTTLFPASTVIAEAIPVPGPDDVLDPDRVLRLPRRQIGTVVATCAALAERTVDIDDLGELHGIGPWTVGYVRMRAGGDRDAWLPGDVALVAGARALGLLDPGRTARESHRALTERSQRWRPWRAYAAMRLWRATTPTRPRGDRAASS